MREDFGHLLNFFISLSLASGEGNVKKRGIRISSVIARKVRYPSRSPSKLIIVLMSPKAIAMARSGETGSSSAKFWKRLKKQKKRGGRRLQLVPQEIGI
jgi:hypothetical protein